MGAHMRAFTFPGQGAQAVGMGRDLAAAYRDALLAWPDLVAWTEAAQAEPWVIETFTT